MNDMRETLAGYEMQETKERDFAIEAIEETVKGKDDLILRLNQELSEMKDEYESKLSSLKVAHADDLESSKAELAKLSVDHKLITKTYAETSAEVQKKDKLLTKIKEELENVVSLKSSSPGKPTVASPEELGESMKLLEGFFADPFTHSLKRVFKLKRVRPEDKSVDSLSLMPKNEEKQELSVEVDQRAVSVDVVTPENVNEN